MSTRVIDRLRQPEYTGENRCVPCTATNVVIAAVLSGIVAYGWFVTVGPLWWLAGAGLFGASLIAIWLRGYLVPGTPRLTKQYFPGWLLRLFDKEPEPAGAPGGLDATAADTRSESETEASGATETGSEPSFGEVDPEELLLRAGVVQPCEHEDDLCLDRKFRANWREQMRDIRESETERDELARELNLDPDDIEFREFDEAFMAHTERGRLGQWESRAALVADLAAARELPEWVDGWSEFPVGARSQLLGGLRIFLERCPVCEGMVEAGTETVESCCRSHEVVAANCEDCGARLLEVSHPGQTAD